MYTKPHNQIVIIYKFKIVLSELRDNWLFKNYF